MRVKYEDVSVSTVDNSVWSIVLCTHSDDVNLNFSAVFFHESSCDKANGG